MLEVGLLIAVAVLAGVFAGLTGAGGGLILVPLLMFMGFTAIDAVSTSNIAVLISAIAATITNSRMFGLPWRRVLLLALPAMCLAPLGAFLASRAPEPILVAAFCVLNVINIVLLGRKAKPAGPSSSDDHAIAAADRTQATDSTHRPPNRDSATVYGARVVGVGGSGGLLAGLFGVGGGLVMVPLQVQWLNTAIQTAARISLAVIIFSSIGAISGHLLLGDGSLHWSTGFILGIGGVIGAPLGARILGRISRRTSTRIFQTTLALVTVSLILRITGVL